MKEIDCPVCRQNTIFWKSKNGHAIYRCNACGFGFVYPFLELAAIEKIYAHSGHGSKFNQTTTEEVLQGEEIYPNSTLDSHRLVSKVQNCHSLKNHFVLDVGAGYGFFTKELIQQGFSVTALELADNERHIFEALTREVPVNSTFEVFEGDNTYGVVLMSQILEHAADVNAWALKTNQLLEKGGLWVIAVPHFNSFTRRLLQGKEFYIIPPEHLNYFTKKSLEMLLEKHGFELLEMETISRLPWHKIPVPGIKYLGNPFLRLMDALGLGMMINVVARKR